MSSGSITLVSNETSYVTQVGATTYSQTVKTTTGYATTDSMGGNGPGSSGSVTLDVGLLTSHLGLPPEVCSAIETMVAGLPPNASPEMIATAFRQVISGLQQQGVLVDGAAVEFLLSAIDQAVGLAVSNTTLAALESYGQSLESMSAQIDLYAQQHNIDPSSMTDAQRAEIAYAILSGTMGVGTTIEGQTALQGQTAVLQAGVSLSVSTTTNGSGVSINIGITIAAEFYIGQNPAGFAGAVANLNNTYPDPVDRGVAARNSLCDFIDRVSSPTLRDIASKVGLDPSLSDAEIASTLKNLIMSIDPASLGMLTAKIMSYDPTAGSYPRNVASQVDTYISVSTTTTTVSTSTETTAELPAEEDSVVRVLRASPPYPEGPDVQELQNRLNELGYGPLEADGIYGPLTANAVRAFQAAAGITVDGIYGPETAAALENASPKVRVLRASPPYPEGPDVTQLQNRLNELGYGPLEADGIYGPLTANAVRAFQIAAGITVDGIYGPETAAALENASPKVRVLRASPPYPEGPDVTQLQNRLNELGYGPLEADGVYGPLTANAVRAFQAAAGITVDGIYGPETAARLTSAAAR